jgi:NADH:ubiquinone reductase (H+-translocating)
MTMESKHRVVIVGGGFGGLYAAKALMRAPVDVTLVDRRNFHLFQPLLYQVATGSLSPGDIAAPLRNVLSRQKNTRVLLGTVSDFDPLARRVLLEDGAAIEYDSLIVAAGSQSSYFGRDDWREFAPSLKTVEEATAIRHKILYAFEAAERTDDSELRKAWLTFVIVGAGPTGVELGGAMGEIARHTLKSEFRRIRPEEAKILILDGSSRVLPVYPEDLSRKAEDALIRLGVRVRSGVRVIGVDQDGVTFQTRDTTDTIRAKTVLWAAGVSASPLGMILAERTGAALDKLGRLEVNPDLTLPGHPEIFVVGDLAILNDEKGNPLPGVAQVAMQGGAYAAKVIVKRIRGEGATKPFAYFDKGDMAVIGRAAAVANLFGVHVSGVFAWLIWLFIHLMYIVEFQSRIKVFLQWGFQYLTFSRGARLITGPTVGSPEA